MSCLLCGKGGSESYVASSDDSSPPHISTAAAASPRPLAPQIISDFDITNSLRGVPDQSLLSGAILMRERLEALDDDDDGDDDHNNNEGGGAAFSNDSGSDAEEDALL